MGVSCSLLQGETLEGELLFSLDIGKLENKIDYFFRGNSLPQRTVSLHMQDGLVYIGNSLGLKVMQFTSYGDLIGLLYNDRVNPRPVLFSSQIDEPGATRARPFSFNFVGEIAITSDSTLLVEDQVQPEREDFDQNSGTVLRYIVQRFSPDGEYLDYIGQEGVGGTSFAFISSIEVTDRDDFIITTRDSLFFRIYWYNKLGELLFVVVLDENYLPSAKNSEAIPRVEAIFPDKKLYRLYVHITFEGKENQNEGSHVYTLEFPSGKYISSFELSKNIQSLSSEAGIKNIEFPFRFIGVDKNSELYFISRNNSYEHLLTVYDSTGRLKLRRILKIDETNMFFNEFHVSNNGIITALVGRSNKVDVFLWNSNRIF